MQIIQSIGKKAHPLDTLLPLTEGGLYDRAARTDGNRNCRLLSITWSLKLLPLDFVATPVRLASDMPDIHRLRCVHCHTTETPLWRTGPDGPRSLCNACGVRFKKGKLILYKDDDGNLTAVKRQDALPVHVPPPAKKSIKRHAHASPPPPSSSPTSDASLKRTVRKVPSDSSLQTTAVGKKPRSRSRRANAGQLPGRYVSAQFSFDSNQHSWRSPTDSPTSSPSSPANSPRFSGMFLLMSLQYSSNSLNRFFTLQSGNLTLPSFLFHAFSFHSCRQEHHIDVLLTFFGRIYSPAKKFHT